MTVQWMTAVPRIPESYAAACLKFWESVTGMTAAPDGTLCPTEADPFLRFDATATAGFRIELHVDNPDATANHGLTLGATPLPGNAIATPTGQAISLVRDSGPHQRPAPIRLPDDTRSLIDQVCIDIPATNFDTEAAFWEQLTGWQRANGSLPEFQYLQRPVNQPLRVLLQRTGDTGPSRAHLDLACSDAGREAERHLQLGARWAWRGPHWITLKDPSGMEYCVTDRDVDASRVFET